MQMKSHKIRVIHKCAEATGKKEKQPKFERFHVITSSGKGRVTEIQNREVYIPRKNLTAIR